MGKTTQDRKTTTGALREILGQSPSKHLFRVDYTANGTPTSGLVLDVSPEAARATIAAMSTKREPLTVGGAYPEPD